MSTKIREELGVARDTDVLVESLDQPWIAYLWTHANEGRVEHTICWVLLGLTECNMKLAYPASLLSL